VTTRTPESVFDVPDSLGLDGKTLLEAGDVTSRVNTALATNDPAAIASLKNDLEGMNSLEGGIDAHDRAI
jgi:hypothetical protein